tara:strand:+ start:395 stop:766 length:372 start_codon:yes stop_codon:yes gene_type:complete
MRALLVLFFSFLPFTAGAEDGSEQFLACDMPILKYTTGDINDDPEWFYSDSVEWVIENYYPYPNVNGLPGYAGWVVLIRMIVDGDEDLEDHIVRSDNLAQVKFNGRWILQQDFERMLCNTIVS